MVSTIRKKTNDRITIEALRYYVPIFQKGDDAEQLLTENIGSYSKAEIHQLEAVMKLKQLSVEAVAELSGPLITREINKLISGSHLKARDDLFDILYYAGLDGMRRGLRKFEVEKMNASSTNYLFQWIITYAKKELTTLEAPFGIPPSRFQRYKKISAVRKKLSEQLKRAATNEEILDYFISGKADLKTLNGRVKDKDKPSQANQSMTLAIIEEQEEFEKNMMNVDLLDPLEDYSSEVKMSNSSYESFGETIFGVFIKTHNITPEAEVVLMSDLALNHFTEAQLDILDNLSSKEYKTISLQWKNLIKDSHGPFYKFLKANEGEDFKQFDIDGAIKNIKNYDKPLNDEKYLILFSGNEAKEL